MNMFTRGMRNAHWLYQSDVRRRLGSTGTTGSETDEALEKRFS